MTSTDPFAPLAAALERHRVRYVVIGIGGVNYFAQTAGMVFATEDRDLFLPPDPRQRYGVFPKGKLVAQTEDVLVDTRGYIYVTDKNQGLFILKYTGK